MFSPTILIHHLFLFTFSLIFELLIFSFYLNIHYFKMSHPHLSVSFWCYLIRKDLLPLAFTSLSFSLFCLCGPPYLSLWGILPPLAFPITITNTTIIIITITNIESSSQHHQCISMIELYYYNC